MAGVQEAAPGSRRVARITPQAIHTLMLGGAVALLAHLGLFLPFPLIVRASAALLLILLPGALAGTQLLRQEAAPWPARVALAGGLGVAGMALWGLALAYLPGPLTQPLVVVGFDALTLAVVGWMVLRPQSTVPAASISDAERARVGPAWVNWLVVLAVVLTGVLRFTHLGYAEFQGDEARAMLMAAGLNQGRDEVLFVHKKGPAEVLLPALVWAAAGGIDEAAARLPFAVANVLAVLAVAALFSGTDSSSSRRVAIMAAVAAVDVRVADYFEACGRIVKYQSIVALMAVLGVWCAWRVWQEGRVGWAAVGGGLVAVGTLAHYEAVFALLPMAYLIVQGLRAHRQAFAGLPGRAVAVLGPSVAFGAVAGFFYLPFILHPHFRETVTYILDRRVRGGGAGGGPLYNNLADYFARATFYNSTWYVVAMIVALVGTLGWAVGSKRQAAGSGQRAAGEDQSSIVHRPSSIVQSTVHRPSSIAFIASFIWFVVPFVVAAFLVQKPHTHFYTMMPGWALLIGWGVGAGGRGLGAREQGSGGAGERRRWGWLLIGMAVVVGLLQVGYLWTVFVRHEPEYKRVYPAARSPLYPVVYGDDPPRGGYFGFPYRAGWGVVAALYQDGTLQGTYDSNEEPLITGWYTRGAARCADNPRTYIVAENVQDAEKIPLDRVQREYHLQAQVMVDGQPKLRVYSRDPVAEVRTYTLADSVALNPAQGAAFPIGQALAEAVPATRTDAAFGPIRLLGYEVDKMTLAAGGTVNLTLFWQADARPSANLSVFTHLEDDRLWAQSDGWPQCGARPTSTWTPGEVVVETRSLRLDAATPPGTYPLRVGLYDAASGQRVPVTGADSAGDQVVVGQVTVRP